eukprot:5203537-Ditylum_brightwellii.AAC.1
MLKGEEEEHMRIQGMIQTGGDMSKDLPLLILYTIPTIIRERKESTCERDLLRSLYVLMLKGEEEEHITFQYKM